LDFRFKTIRRKTAFQLQKVETRAHIVDGLLVALGKIDQVIELVRSAADQSAVREALMDEEGVLGLSKEQADSVMKLQLGQLTRLNVGKLDDEKKDLEVRGDGLTRLLEVDEAVYDVMTEEFKTMDSKFGEDRKTKILYDDGEVNEIDMITNARSGKCNMAGCFELVRAEAYPDAFLLQLSFLREEDTLRECRF
jgi:DNA gyrase subunit A